MHFPQDLQTIVLELLADLGNLEGGTKLSPTQVMAELERRSLRGISEEAKKMPLPNPKRGMRVRLELRAEGSKARKVLVVRRDSAVEALLLKAKQALKTKRHPRYVYVAATGLALRDLATVEDGTAVCVGDDELRDPPDEPSEPETPVAIGSREAWEDEVDAASWVEEDHSVLLSDDDDDKKEGRGAAAEKRPPERNDSPIGDDRSRLPAYAAREEILRAVRKGRVTIVAGATGCGKSTQIPQIILEDCDERRERCKIVVAEPRRLAAVSLAERVGLECRTGPGDVGYTVRLERRNVRARIEFCTTGVLLRRLRRPDYLRDLTHVVVDEAHERSTLTDLALVLLKESSSSSFQTKLVVMSATLDVEFFVDYFPSAAAVEVPGRVFEVDVGFLDETNAALRTRYATIEDEAPGSLLAPEAKQPLDCRAVAAVVVAVASRSTGAVLAFAPGAAEIDKICRFVRDQLPEYRVLPLHAGLSSAQQRRVFEKYPEGKIVVATDVAETGLTIDDVTDVVDTGRVREMRYARGIARLAEVWVSKASAAQRAGRAGRCSAGRAWRLYSRQFFLRGLPELTAPEMIRTPLEDVTLTILRLGHQPCDLLDKAPAPPEPGSVRDALDALGAGGLVARPPEECDDDEELFAGEDWTLTPLGYHVANLPVDWRLAKFLVLACLFGCLETALTVAAAISAPKDVFYAPPLHLRKQASDARKALAAGTRSDLIAVAAARRSWLDSPDRRAFCADHFISGAALAQVDKLRDYLRASLERAGWPTDASQLGPPRVSYLYDLAVLRGVLCAGLQYAVTHPDSPRLAAPHKSTWYCHPSSVNFQEVRAATRPAYVVYARSLVTSKPYLLDTSLVDPVALLLFAGSRLDTSLDGRRLVLDGWLPFRLTTRAALALGALRREIDALLLRFVRDRADPRAQALATKVVAAVRSVLALLQRPC